MAYNLLPPGHGAASCEGYFFSCGHAVLCLELSRLLRGKLSCIGLTWLLGPHDTGYSRGLVCAEALMTCTTRLASEGIPVAWDTLAHLPDHPETAQAITDAMSAALENISTWPNCFSVWLMAEVCGVATSIPQYIDQAEARRIADVLEELYSMGDGALAGGFEMAKHHAASSTPTPCAPSSE